jgi:hypothetical protein
VAETKGLFSIVNSRFGRLAYPEVTSYTIGSAATQVLKDDADRVQYIIFNTGDYPVFIGWSPDVSPQKGVRIPERGGSLSLNWEEDGILPAYSVWAVAPFGNTTVYILEIRLGK